MTRRRFFRVVLVVAAMALGFWCWNRRHPIAPTKIFEGVTYGCERLESDAEGSGLVHWVRVDLAAPGIELYVTPLDPAAVAMGWQFRLRHTGAAVQHDHLAIGINATMFDSSSGWLPLTGDLSRARETTVADHRVSHVWEHTYLLWFDDRLTPALETSKPPSAAVLDKARWGVGGQGVGLMGGKVRDLVDRKPVDARTAVGIDRQQKQLFLVVFEKASARRALEKMAELGAMEGMLLDGGDSTSMALGEKSLGVRPGVLLSGWRPVATHFGVRANALRPK